MERRGIHVMMGNRTKLPAVETLIREVAPALNLNYILLEVNGNFQYKSHPEVSGQNAMSAVDAAHLAAAAKSRGIALVPMYNCLGHQSWRANPGPLLRAHPEFNEAPELDPAAEGFYCMSWCPNHPDLNPLLFDLFDELIEAFQAQAFHVGMDEVFILGHCPRCKGSSNAALFAGAVQDYHRHLVAHRGMEMQMWGDRLLDSEAMGYGGWESSKNETSGAISLIPKDIVMCDWHYGLKDDYPSVRFFQDQGFRVWPAGWNQEESIRRFIDVARRESGPGMLGYLATTWTDVEKLIPCLRGGEPPDEKIAAIANGVRLGVHLSQN